MNNDVSCRVTATILKFFQNEKRNNSSLLSGIDVSEDFLTDPNNWVSRDVVKIIFDRMERICFDPNIAFKIGMSGSTSGAWGVCDYIFRMIGAPEQIYIQAKRFGNYFYRNIELKIVEKTDHSIKIQLLGDGYSPNDVKFLQGALAGIQKYWNLEPADSNLLTPNTILIALEPNRDFFGQHDVKTALSPKLIQDTIDKFDQMRLVIEKKNIELELKNRLLREFNVKIKDLEKGREVSVPTSIFGEIALGVLPGFTTPIDKSIESVTRLREYLTSTLTIINWFEQISESTEDIEVKERKRLFEKINRLKVELEIEYIREQFPKILNQTLQDLKKMKKSLRDIKGYSEVEREKMSSLNVKEQRLE